MDLVIYIIWPIFVVFMVVKSSKTTESLMKLNGDTRKHWIHEQTLYRAHRLLTQRLIKDQASYYLTHLDKSLRDFAEAILQDKDKQLLEELTKETKGVLWSMHNP